MRVIIEQRPLREGGQPLFQLTATLEQMLGHLQGEVVVSADRCSIKSDGALALRTSAASQAWTICGNRVVSGSRWVGHGVATVAS